MRCRSDRPPARRSSVPGQWNVVAASSLLWSPSCRLLLLRRSPGCLPGGAPASISERWRPLTPLGVPDRLVGEVGDAALEGLSVEEAHGFLVAGLGEQALAGPGGDREDLQPQLVDQVVLDQRAYELKAAGDDDVPVYVLLQRRDLVKHVALEDCRVVPGGIGEVADTTYLGSLSASSPLRDGHRAASHS